MLHEALNGFREIGHRRGGGAVRSHFLDSQPQSGLSFDARGRLLIAKGFAETGTEKNRPWLVKESIPGEGRPRVVHILPSIFEGDDD